MRGYSCQGKARNRKKKEQTGRKRNKQEQTGRNRNKKEEQKPIKQQIKN